MLVESSAGRRAGFSDAQYAERGAKIARDRAELFTADVVNPEARTNPASPIGGMPIIDCDKARTVVVVKRSLSPGFAGIPNPLFAAENTLMYFGDGKKAMLNLVSALKE